MSQKTTGSEPVNRRTASAIMRGADCRPGSGRAAKPEQERHESPGLLELLDRCVMAREFGPVLEYQRIVCTRELKGGGT